MSTKVLFSVIIPHRNSKQSLPKLFSSIPVSEDIEIFLIDNSTRPIVKKDLRIDRHYQLLFSDPSHGAGGARNIGIENAKGKWLIFIDADDYLSDDAFLTFYQNYNSKAELIYFCMEGVYIDSGERSDRGDNYTNLVKGFLAGDKSETDLRLKFVSPCAKMVRRELIERHNIRYDEVIASNDVYFSLLTGYFAKSIAAVDKITYIATVSKGTLTNRRDFEVTKARFEVVLRYNKFVKEHGLNKYQMSIMIYLFRVSNFGIVKFMKFLKLMIEYRQNPFIGINRWIHTYFSNKRNMSRDKNYIIK